MSSKYASSLSRTLVNTVFPILSNIGNIIYWLVFAYLIVSTIISTSYVIFSAFRELYKKTGNFGKWFLNKAAIEGGENVDLQNTGYVAKNIILLNVALFVGITIFKRFVYGNVGLSLLNFILDMCSRLTK